MDNSWRQIGRTRLHLERGSGGGGHPVAAAGQGGQARRGGGSGHKGGGERTSIWQRVYPSPHVHGLIRIEPAPISTKDVSYDVRRPPKHVVILVRTVEGCLYSMRIT